MNCNTSIASGVESQRRLSTAILMSGLVRMSERRSTRAAGIYKGVLLIDWLEFGMF